ncbi:MAG TPA: rhamnulose-1-phosphate aldolase [Bacteroidales bacterium]|nr:rhamnulose-1-phosphate aldolase [Bacteroidales bacterium]HRZ76002.1 rhamnulose-1-phosphate aldolase [Bacteroidales bacterium]
MKELLTAFAETAALIDRRGWAERNAGNISMLQDRSLSLPRHWEEQEFHLSAPSPLLRGSSMMISASGSRMRDLARNPEGHCVVLSFLEDGKALFYRSPAATPCSPSSELPTHLLVHQELRRQRPEQRALVHAHVVPLIQISHHPGADNQEGLNDILLRLHPETLYFLPQGLGLVPFRLPGTEDLAEETARQFQQHDVVLWERHGALACGPDPVEAFDRLDIVARAAGIFLGCKSAGISPKTFTEEEFRGLRNYYDGLRRKTTDEHSA